MAKPSYKVFDCRKNDWVRINSGEVHFWHYLSDANKEAKAIGGASYSHPKNLMKKSFYRSRQ